MCPRVFAEIEPIIRSALDGHNVCIFAYGQTGSGKTFTMEGSKDEPGVVPRSLQRLFEEASYDTNVNYSYSLSMLEVYKGSLRDLPVARPTRNSDHVTKRAFLDWITLPVPGPSADLAQLGCGRKPGCMVFSVELTIHGTRPGGCQQ